MLDQLLHHHHSCFFFFFNHHNLLPLFVPSSKPLLPSRPPPPLAFSHPHRRNNNGDPSNVVMVTGGAGFIGCHTSLALLARGDRVLLVDNLSDHGYPPSVKSANLKWLRELAAELPGSLKVVEGDITDRSVMAPLFADRIDVVCHLAAHAGVRDSILRPESYINTNVAGTAILLELASSASCSNFVYASSSSIYGSRRSNSDLTSEPSMLVMSESDGIGQPMSPYAASKVATETLAGVYHHLYKLPTTGLRFFTVYGPRGRPDMAPRKFMNLIYKGLPIEQFGDGSSWRDYTYIDDVVSGVLAAIDKPHECEVFNIGAGQPVRLLDFIYTLEKVMGCTAIVVHKDEQKGDIFGTYADITKARQMLDYNPKVTLEDGLQRMFVWFKENEHVGRNKLCKN